MPRAAAIERLRRCKDHLRGRAALSAVGAPPFAAGGSSPAAVSKQLPHLSIRAGHSAERLFELRRRSFDEQGFVIVDDFQEHPLLPALTAAARRITAAAVESAAAVDPATAYVHRASPFRGESRGVGWTGATHVFQAEQAWAIRGALHPAWAAPSFAEFLGQRRGDGVRVGLVERPAAAAELRDVRRHPVRQPQRGRLLGRVA